MRHYVCVNSMVAVTSSVKAALIADIIVSCKR